MAFSVNDEVCPKWNQYQNENWTTLYIYDDSDSEQYLLCREDPTTLESGIPPATIGYAKTEVDNKWKLAD